MAEEVKTIQEELSFLILLSDRVIKSALEAESSKAECGELANQADRLAHKLRSAARLAAQPIYDRPLRRVAADVRKNLERAITLARKCRHSGILRQVFAIAATADFRRVGALLESSIADVTWILSIFDSDGGANLSLPPIASNDPILAMLWSSIASVQIGQLRDRVDAANNLASLARDNDRNKKMIVEEGGIVPLLKLLKEGACPEAQIAAALALSSLGNDQDRVQLIAGELAVPIVVKVLGDSPARVQVAVANLVAKMAEMDPNVQDELGRENVTRPLVTLLGFDTVLDDPKLQSGKTSIHSLVQIARDPVTNIHNSSSSSSLHSDGSSRGGNHKKERGIESPELKLELKISCAKALWKLSRVMELAAVAETNADLRRASFKPNSSAAKAVLEQLLRVVNEENSPALLIPAIKSIGCLARTFPAKESRIIGPLVSRLGHRDVDVSSEAVISLGKFACPDNFNHVEHSKAIIEFDGVPRLMNLLKISGRDQVNELVLLCYLASHVGNNKAFEQVRARDVLEGAARSVVAQHPDLRELFAKAVHHLTLYQVGAHTHRQAYAP
ncbi:armadillo repeat only 4 [Actinidia rufa]|uniref:Armadillo repeat only 4 n=1 Tax=Actinidia rufa TaxID=165716 RepID=A0A7J0G0U5_9ERIC|nr:armadillo repeat only 4 [Actinidia rufa]